MDYKDLWDRFLDVKDYWSENRKLLEEFCNILKEKADLDKTYGKGLEKISKNSLFDRSFGTSSPFFQGMKNFYMETSQNFISTADQLQNDVIQKLKKLISSHDSSIQDFKSQGKKLVIEREKLIKSHLKSRSKYWKICKENESVSKTNTKAIQIEENCNKAYMSAISQLNSFNSVFLEGISKVLTLYQEQNIEKLQFLKQSLQLIVTNEAGIIYSMRMLIDHLPFTLETFSPETDQKMFISSTYTGRQLELESFISYSQSMTTESGTSDNELSKIINNCWEGIKLTEESTKYYDSVIGQDEGKKRFILLLNDKRKNAQFKLPWSTFKDLGHLFNRALNTFYELEYLSLAKQCIILSQTFFTLNEETGEKVFLQTQVNNHKLWQKEDYWEYMVDNAVDSALDSLNEFADGIEDAENDELKKKSVIGSAIISYTHMMASFGVDKEKIMVILVKSKEKYLLSDFELPINDILLTLNE
jgi:hypothetical protein